MPASATASAMDSVLRCVIESSLSFARQVRRGAVWLQRPPASRCPGQWTRADGDVNTVATGKFPPARNIAHVRGNARPFEASDAWAASSWPDMQAAPGVDERLRLSSHLAPYGNRRRPDRSVYRTFQQEEEASMDFKIDRRSALKAGAALAAASRCPPGRRPSPRSASPRCSPTRTSARDMIQHVRRRTSRPTSRSSPSTAARCSSRAPSSSRCSATTSRWATSRRRTSPTRCPAWSILTSAYLFRDADHLNAFFASDLGARDEEAGRGRSSRSRSSGRPSSAPARSG